MQVSYDIYFKSGDTESITKYRFPMKQQALRKAIMLNNGLKLKGYTDREYIVYKIIKERVING